MTLLTSYHKVLRALLADRDPDIPLYDSDQLSDALTAVVNLGKVPDYAISSDGAGIEPDLTPALDAQSYARLIYHAAKLFAVSLTSSSFRSRAFSESFGTSKELVNSIIEELYRLENGDQSS